MDTGQFQLLFVLYLKIKANTIKKDAKDGNTNESENEKIVQNNENEEIKQDQDDSLGRLLEGWDLIPSLVPTFKKPTEEADIEDEPPDLGFKYPGSFCLHCASTPCLCMLLKMEMKLKYLEKEMVMGKKEEEQAELGVPHSEIQVELD